MNQAQNNVTKTDSSTHVKDTVRKVEATSIDMAEDVDAEQLEANTRRTEVDTTATHTWIVRTREESTRRAQNVTKKRIASPTQWEDQTTIVIES